MTFQERLQADQALIETALQGYTRQWPDYGQLRHAMAYSLLSGGKRIRPVMVLEVCRMLGGNQDHAMPLACALEMVHTYSLIHDDLPCMDDDDLRRGRPTNHKIYGEATAVLAGDALLTAAFSTIAEAKLPSAQVQRAVSVLASAAGLSGMVGGQMLDLMGEGKSLTQEEILATEALKTGCMIRAAAQLGVIAANGSQTEEDAVVSYAQDIGLAFQIKDDLLDVIGDQAEFGKPIGSDLDRNKATLVALKGVDACEAWVDELTKRAVDALQNFSQKQFLCELALFLAQRKK